MSLLENGLRLTLGGSWGNGDVITVYDQKDYPNKIKYDVEPQVSWMKNDGDDGRTLDQHRTKIKEMGKLYASGKDIWGNGYLEDKDSKIAQDSMKRYKHTPWKSGRGSANAKDETYEMLMQIFKERHDDSEED